MSNYPKAYTEVLEIIKYLPKEERDKIPAEKIKFYEQNCDKEYEFTFDIEKPIDEQNTLRETNAIVVVLFRDYFATTEQKEKLEKILQQNEEKHQQELREKYNPDNIFKKPENRKNEEAETTETMALVEVKKDNVIKEIFKKIINFIKGFNKKD